MKPGQRRADDSGGSGGASIHSSSGDPESLGTADERDEVKEIQKDAQPDTRRVRFGRGIVTGLLLLTSIGVTVTTFVFLSNGQDETLDAVYTQFSRALLDSAVQRQQGLEKSFNRLASHLTSYAENTNSTWPFVTMPAFERFGGEVLEEAFSTIFTVANLVEDEQRADWVAYADTHHQSWVKEGHMIRYGNLNNLNETAYSPFVKQIFDSDERDDNPSPCVAWLMSPPPDNYTYINWNFNATFGYIIPDVFKYQTATLTAPADYRFGLPQSFIFVPIREKLNDMFSRVVAVIGAVIPWESELHGILPEGVAPLVVVISNTCNQTFSYEIRGPEARYLGDSDYHDPTFDAYEESEDLVLSSAKDLPLHPRSANCNFRVSVYPTKEFVNLYNPASDVYFTVVVATTFFVVIATFFLYDMLVQRRNRRLIFKAARSNAIVSSLFPGAIRDRMLQTDNTETGKKNRKKWDNGPTSLKAFLTFDNAEVGNDNSQSKPIADLFLETTIMFADIAGFTAWSSVREPSQVFTLLENVYRAFDDIAKHRRVFKVETVGDCYVAVAGLPEPRKDHAIVMCRFARDCLAKMRDVVTELEVVLGPDTGELTVRIGLHSGPVTAGVLRGDRARFQLFGDTMNTTARIESTSEKNKVHLSEETANLLIEGGKAHWVTKREGKVAAKGKGVLQTYWLTGCDRRPGDSYGTSISDGTGSAAEEGGASLLLGEEPGVLYACGVESMVESGLSERTHRLIDWNVDLLLKLLKQVIARRDAADHGKSEKGRSQRVDEGRLETTGTVLEEVKEVIRLPGFDPNISKRQVDPQKVVVSDFVVDQLQDYVTCIATMYRNNPFHNFDHASHVAMSVGKLMSRIVAPTSVSGMDDISGEVLVAGSHAVAATLHDHTYGITSDPLTQFACAFSALIHDVDHTGVPNTQLVKENCTIANLYKNRSVAEQNSFDLAWDLLMDKRYADLRAMIYSTDEELLRFRQLVVNGVMATDIVDKDLKALRNDRWAKAFHKDDMEQPIGSRNHRRDRNRKATIVIEHLIQASDVAHTMQHWHIYRKWNERLFMEMHKAFQAGRAEKDPAEFWYEGEIGFFDFYIIPLARKLKDCGVFGVCSDEYLNYALRNRQEWADRGKEVVAEMIETAKVT